MKVEIFKKDNCLAVVMEGRLVLDVMDTFRSILEPHITPHLDLIFIVLNKVDYIDCAGLGILVELKIQCGKSRIRMALADPSAEVTNILAVSRLEEVFEIQTGIDAERNLSEMIDPTLRIEKYDTKIQIAHKAEVVSAAESPVNGQPALEPALAVAPQPQMAAVNNSSVKPNNSPSVEAVDSMVKSAIEEHCKSAVESLRKGDLESSIESYKKAIDLDPNYIPARNNLAIVYEKKPAWKQMAIEQWEVLMQLSQDRNDQKHIDRAHKHLAKLRA